MKTSQWRSKTGAFSTWRRFPTGPVTVVLVADGSMWLVRWLRNFFVQLQFERVEPIKCQSLQIADSIEFQSIVAGVAVLK